ncbi:MAG: hypothetical protein LLG04_18040 [Parachlamydia sp.]|nr:hypothetical protein [Parachlamydia sp.]
MRILQNPCTDYSQIDHKHIQQAIEGKWYQLNSRTFLVKADGKYLAVSFNCLERIAAAFLKIIRVDYFKRIFMAKEFKLLTPRMPQASKEAVDQTPAAYDLDRALDQVRAEAARVQGLNKKFCLFLCRGSHQTVPQNPNEVWMSLDRTYNTLIDRRIHVKMDINDPRLSKLLGLFDKVIMDQCSMQFMGHTFPWRVLRGLLKKSPQAELITDNARNIDHEIFQSEADWHRQPINHLFHVRQGHIRFPWVLGWDAAQREVARRNGIEEGYSHLQGYLQTLFNEAVLIRQQPFPCQKGVWDYMVMKGPKA